MLFNLTPGLVSEENNIETKPNIIRAIEHVLRGVWASKHLVTSDLETIIKLKKIITCRDSLSVLIHLENNYSFLNYDSITYSINIIVGDNIIQKETIEDKTYLNLSIDFLQTSDITNATRILCEDISDAVFFEKICKYYISKNDLGNISLKYEKDHGGGNQISRIYEKNLLAGNTFCLTFSDNDKRYPTCEIGNTLGNLISINHSSLLCKFLSLECQEIENLVPFNYLRDIQNITHEENGIVFIENIINSDKKEFLKYFDFKKGISKKQILASPDYLDFSKDLEEYSPVNIDFTNLDSYENTHKIIPQVGKILPAFIEKHDVLINTQPIFLEYQEIEWNKIGSEFLNWTCARNNEPLNT